MNPDQVKTPQLRERPEPPAPPPAAERDGRPAPASRIGTPALIAVSTSLGLLLVSLSNALSRATLDPSLLIYWAGLLAIALPVFWRLVSKDASDRERLLLVCVLGMALYGVKLFRDSLLFTFPDEFIHVFNAERIVDSNHLFGSNSIQKISPDYPGLEGATSALMSTTGMSSYGSGILLIGAARLTMVVGLFLLFRRIGGSARVAGLAVAIYITNFNFLYFDAQFSYESLALPILVVVLMAVAERDAAPASSARGWAVPIVLGTGAIVATHHLSSYALVVLLASIALAHWLFADRRVESGNPWRFAMLAFALCVFWLVAVAAPTFEYLGAVLSDAFVQLKHTLAGESSPRTLFQSTTDETGGNPIASAPPIARVVTFTGVLLLLVALPFGLLAVWRRYRRHPFAPILSLAALAFFGTLALRFVPAAWESANRASEFLFLGLAFVVALAAVLAYSRIEERSRRPWAAPAAIAGALGIVFAGGIISSWPWDAQLAPPMRVTTEGREIRSESLALGDWVERNLPEGRYAATEGDSRLVLHPGGAYVLSGNSPAIESLLKTASLDPWELPLLRQYDLRYVVADLRRRGIDTTRSYSFSLKGSPDSPLPLSVIEKWETVPGSTRIFDSGNIVIYDIGESR